MAVAPWLEPPNWLSAIESGLRAGEAVAAARQRGRRTVTEAGVTGGNSELDFRKQAQQAANQIQQQRLAMQAILGQQRNQNQADAITARKALDDARAAADASKSSVFNTGGGLMQRDPVTGEWKLVPGSSKPQNLGTAKVPVDPNDPNSASYDVPMSSPLYQNWAKMKSTVTPGTPGVPDFRFMGLPIPFTGTSGTPAVTNNPPSLRDYLKSSTTYSGNAADALSRGSNPALRLLPDVNTAPQANTPPQSHISYLTQHPETAADFDQKYGAGSSAQYINNLPDAGPTSTQEYLDNPSGGDEGQ
jgi:hypothetical protein